MVVSLVAGPDRETTDRRWTRFCAAAPMCRWSGASWWSMPACPPRIAGCWVNVMDSSSLAISAPLTGPGAQLAHIRPQIHRRFWLHLGQGWRLFAPERSHNPPDGGARGRTRGVPGGNQPRRCGQADRAPARSRGCAPSTRASRYLLTDVVASAGDVRYRTAVSCSVWRAPTRIRSPNLGAARQLPSCAQPASTRCSASPQSDPSPRAHEQLIPSIPRPYNRRKT